MLSDKLKQFQSVLFYKEKLPNYFKALCPSNQESIKNTEKFFSDLNYWSKGYGDEFIPSVDDWNFSGVKESYKSGKITVYSVLPIENGAIISPSKIVALDFGENLNSKEISIYDVIWFNQIFGMISFQE